MTPLSRRTFLASSAALAVGARWDSWFAAAANTTLPTPAWAKLVGTVPFDGEPEVRFGEVKGEGLAARRFLDLADLDERQLVTPTARYFLRTGTPEGLPDPATFRLSARALATMPLELSLADLRAMAEPQGVHLCESADNGRAAGFGLMSAAEWSGVPLMRLVERIGVPEVPWMVLVEGLDRFAGNALRLDVGAGWIFKPEELAATGAFLALDMNGQPLSAQHGAPVRLVVPSWYGCTWIKWVHSVVLVAPNARATPHMREFSWKTHQGGSPKRAEMYGPAVVDATALPVRVERWKREGKLFYRLVGIVWGGGKPAESVSIRIQPGAATFVPVEHYHPPAAAANWSLWAHTWQPKAPGTYTFDLQVGRSRLRSRRLAAGDYTRRVTIAKEA